MLSQTIIQLYRQSIEAGFDESSLVRIRNAYALSRPLFVGKYRASGKPFTAHLVGTASALVGWGESPDMAAAGLLHSAYRYGEFGDRTKKLTPGKREAVRSLVGAEAEALVEQFSRVPAWTSVAAMEIESKNDASRDLVVLALANLLDDCWDAGPLFSPEKALSFNLPTDAGAREAIRSLASTLVGDVAEQDFARAFDVIDSLDSLGVPPCLTSSEQRQFAVERGLPELTVSRFRARVNRLKRKIGAD